MSGFFRHKSIFILSLLFLLWFSLHSSYIVIDSLTSKPGRVQYIIILGSKVNRDGTLSTRLKARLDEALELYNSGFADSLFVSGGLGEEGYYEGDEMAKYLVEMGIEKGRILIDNEGNNTWLTATNFKIARPQVHSVIVVTQYFHLTRTKLAHRKAGIERVYGSSPLFFEWRDPYSIFREFFGFYKYLVVY
jgi:vancomycin permeability regulator SanA